jgi:hypothetical protein
MVFRRLLRLSGLDKPDQPSSEIQPTPTPLPYSWIISNQLAIGPMPQDPNHWDQLQKAGFKSRFSCCYSEEERLGASIPEGWSCSGVALPDHREQEALDSDRLILAIRSAEMLVRQSSPTYLHCLAGRERSALMAVALTSLIKGIDIFESLDWVRRCHPIASPLYDQLELLDQVLRQLKS